jgi:hypothetical protein
VDGHQSGCTVRHKHSLASPGGAGRYVNVHFESHQWFAVAVEWTQRMVATGGGPCRT